MSPASGSWLVGGLLLVTTVVVQGFTDVATRGIANWDSRGTWECPASIGWDFTCSNGKVYCTCPGNLDDTTSTYYWITCDWDDTWRTHWCGQPKAGRNYYDCSQYENCQTCRTNINWGERHVCGTCQEGWQGPGCRDDVDECRITNGGCDHTCVNSNGSYSCECNEGHLLYNQKSCKRVDCSPINVEGVKVTYSGDARASTYAKFECIDPAKVVSGPAVSLCEMKDSIGEWTVNNPSCVDVPPFSATQPFIRISGKSPVPKYLNKKRKGYNPGSCYNICARQPFECKAYADITRIDKGVLIHDCYLVSKPYIDLYLANELNDATEASIFAILVTESIDPNIQNYPYKDLQWKMIDRSIGCYRVDDVQNWQEYEFPSFTKAKALDSYDWDIELSRALKIECNHRCLRLGFDFFGTRAVLPNCYCGQFPPVTPLYARTCDNDVTMYKTEGERNGKCYKDAWTYGVYGKRELTVRKWLKDEGKSKKECLDSCRDEGYPYAGLQRGGDCYCGNHYDYMEQNTDQSLCNVPCVTDPRDTCGGEDGVKQVFSVYPAKSFLNFEAYDFVRLDTTKLYDDMDLVTGVTTGIFSKLEGLHLITTKRLVLYSSEPIKPIAGDPSLKYRDCGEIQNSRAVRETKTGGTETILRFFFMRLSKLGDYIQTKLKPVRVYAQTFVIDADVDLTFSLLVRATQILYDPSRIFTITVVKEAPPLEFDLGNMKHDGPEPNLQFMKESFMCVRMLRETKTDANILTGWLMTYELLNLKPADKEQRSLQVLIQNYKTKFVGVDAAKIHILSDYTREHLSKVMQTYVDTIQTYKDDLDKLELQETTHDQFIEYAEKMNVVYINTSIAEAKSNYEDAILEYEYTNGVYRHMYIKYNTARQEMLAAQKTFEDAIIAKQTQNAFNAILGFLGGVADVVAGIISLDVGQAVNGVIDAYDSIQSLDLSLYKLGDLVNSIERFINISDDNLNAMKDQTTPYDDEKYKADIEKTATLSTSIIEWENLKGDADKILAVDDLKWAADTSGADYGKAIQDLSNWGQALATTMIEKAEKTREALAWRVTWDIRLQQQERASKAIEEMKESEKSVKRLQAMEIMKEQAYGVTVGLNEILISFCQSYFFDTLQECKASFRPNLGGSLSDVLRRVHVAQREGLLAMPPALASSTTVDIQITDRDTDPDCSDLKKCPINYFKKNGEVYYTVATDDPNLVGLHQYRVSEIILDFEGVTGNGGQPYLNVRLGASGHFKGVSFNRTFDFLGKSLALEYEYDVELGIRDKFGIRKHADIYERFRGIVPHMTPYTTWYIKVNKERSSHVDLSGLTRIRMYFKGSTTTKSTRRRHYLDILLHRAFGKNVKESVMTSYPENHWQRTGGRLSLI